jgi:hypothetical protein
MIVDIGTGGKIYPPIPLVGLPKGLDSFFAVHTETGEVYPCGISLLSCYLSLLC